MKHTITINNKVKHTSKPINVAAESINCNNVVEVTIREFANLVTQPNGHTWCPATFKDNKRSNNNWLQQSMFALDFDNGISISDVVCKLQSVNINPNIVYTSFSDTSALRKFRVVLFVDKVIDNSTEVKLMQLKLMNLFEGSVDIACKDYARMFFGGKELVMISEELNSVDVINKLDVPTYVQPVRTYNLNINQVESNVTNNKFTQVELNDLKVLEKSALFNRFKNGEWLYHDELFALATNLYWITHNKINLLHKMKTTMIKWNNEGKTQYTENNFNIINSQLMNKYSPASLKQLDKNELYTNLLVLVKFEMDMDNNKLKNEQNSISESNSSFTLVVDKKEMIQYRNANQALLKGW